MGDRRSPWCRKHSPRLNWTPNWLFPRKQSLRIREVSPKQRRSGFDCCWRISSGAQMRRLRRLTSYRQGRQTKLHFHHRFPSRNQRCKSHLGEKWKANPNHAYQRGKRRAQKEISTLRRVERASCTLHRAGWGEQGQNRRCDG